MEYTYRTFTLLVVVCVFATVSSNYVPHQWHGTVCLSCKGVSRLTDCRTVQRCSQQQECYVERVIPGAHHFNRAVYNLGCVTNQHMSWASHGGFPICTYKCHGTLCNQYGCGLTGFRIDRGSVCYSCQNERTRNSCTTIDICWPRESCAIRRMNNTVNISYSASCESTKMCQYAPALDDRFLQHAVGRRHSDVIDKASTSGDKIHRQSRASNECLKCCTDDLCNDMECVRSTHPPTTTPTTTFPRTTVPAITWGPWMAWSSCSASCGRGNQARVRTCMPGSSCRGSTVDMRSCNIHTCSTAPVDGHWGVWGHWQRCSTTCGQTRYQHRFRHCDSPVPQNGGHRCSGRIYDTRKCNDIPCCMGPPVITHLDNNVSVLAGSMVVLQCNATGLDSLIWEGPKVVGRAFPSNVNILPSGNTLLISGLKAENTGVYRCVTKNQCGTVSRSTTVSIRNK